MRMGPGEFVGLAVGERFTLPDAAQVHYVGIANDSRCPPAVQCLRAGDADVLFDLIVPGAEPSRIVLNTERAPAADAGPWRLHLAQLAPGEHPLVTLRVATRDTGISP